MNDENHELIRSCGESLYAVPAIDVLFHFQRHLNSKQPLQEP